MTELTDSTAAADLYGTPNLASRRRWPHPAWLVAAVAFVALVGAGGFRAAPGVLIVPLEDEFGWSRSLTSGAVAVNLVLFGLTAPFAAALMDRYGLRRVTASALCLIALGSGLTVWMTASWQLVLLWGFLVGLGTGSMALVFAATVAQRWFVRHRGLVMGVLTAGSAAGQLVFLPVTAWLAETAGWRTASVVISLAALAVVPLVLVLLRDKPADLGVRAYGAPALALPADGETVSQSVDRAGDRGSGRTSEASQPAVAANSQLARSATVPPYERPASPARVALQALRDASRTRSFWALAAGFAICGASTNGLIGTHFVPAAHDHGMPQTTAAGLLAVVGVFDIVGTICSGWLTDRVDPRLLLAVYYVLRGASLAVLPMLFSDQVHPSVIVFIVFYGLDWVATVPPTVALCRELYGDRGTVVFGWVFASHQIGAAVVAAAAGVIRDLTGAYTIAWLSAGGLCAVAAVLSGRIRKTPLPSTTATKAPL